MRQDQQSPSFPESPPKGAVLFSWKARDNRDRGAGGVTDKPDLASVRLTDAMEQYAPGAEGSIIAVSLDQSAKRPSYRHGPVLAVAHKDHTTGALVLEAQKRGLLPPSYQGPSASNTTTERTAHG